MPIDNFLGRRNLEKVLPLLTKDELWACEHYFEPDVVLNRIRPDIAITCNINTLRTPPRFAKEVVQVLDLYGPLQFEGLLLDTPDYEAAKTSGPLLEERCKAMVESLRTADYVVTVSERQKYFWSAYCSLAGFSFDELNVLLCPVAFDVPPVERHPAENLTVVYAGGFYPWQNPNRFLERAAEILDKYTGAELHIFGGPHAGLTNEKDVQALLERLQRHGCVRYHGYRPVEELVSRLATAWCALELMERNIERELAITGRTVEFLSTGTPVIYNNYSTLSGLIERYGAGWTTAVDTEPDLDGIFRELAEGGLPYLERLSANAIRLARNEFCAEKALAPLAALCGSEGLQKRGSPRPVPAPTRPAANRAMLQRVLAIVPGDGALAELRIRNPLRALHRQNLIGGFRITAPDLAALRGDQNTYDAIVTQRALPRFVYDLLGNLSLRFLLDVDDNLLARAKYRSQDAEDEIALGLRGCAVLSAPNPRLVRSYERYTGLPLASKSFITPNSLPFPPETAARKQMQPPAQLIWIQSDIAALAASRGSVVAAVDAFSAKYDLPVVLIGPNVLKRPQFRNQIVMGEIDFGANLQFLANTPTGIGVAPLETDADQETLDFVAGKSDLKMLLFAGFGHAGVYSAAPPYTDSELGFNLAIIGNSESEWRDALEHEYAEGWKTVAATAQEIQLQRNCDAVARENWLPALEAVRLTHPVSGDEIYRTYDSCRLLESNAAHQLAYLLENDDVLTHCMMDGNYTAFAHYARHGKAEGRRLRHTLEGQRDLLAKMDKEFASSLSRLTAEVERVSTENKELRLVLAEVERLSNENQDLRRKLAGVVESKSWKLTAPLRNLRNRSGG